MPTNAIKKTLINERESHTSGGLYHLTQIKFAYNSNHIEGSKLTEEQTRLIYETQSILPNNNGEAVLVNDVIESSNHFRLFDYILDHVDEPLQKEHILEMHRILKTGTTDASKDWFAVGAWKKHPNSIGDFVQTTKPQDVEQSIHELLSHYHNNSINSLSDMIDFHVNFERIHPFQDGNGRVGRAILFKECLRHNIVPFIIEERQKLFYYRGLSEYSQEPGYLVETCLAAQDQYKKYCEYYLNIDFEQDIVQEQEMNDSHSLE